MSSGLVPAPISIDTGNRTLYHAAMSTTKALKFTPGEIKSAFNRLMAQQRWSKLNKAQRHDQIAKSWIKRKINHPPKGAAK